MENAQKFKQNIVNYNLAADSCFSCKEVGLWEEGWWYRFHIDEGESIYDLKGWLMATEHERDSLENEIKIYEITAGSNSITSIFNKSITVRLCFNCKNAICAYLNKDDMFAGRKYRDSCI